MVDSTCPVISAARPGVKHVKDVRVKKNIIMLIAAFLSFWPVIVYGQSQGNRHYLVNFNLDRDSCRFVIRPTCVNRTKKEAVLRYRIEFRRMNKSKTLDNPITQSGILQLLPGEEKYACTMEVPSPGKDGYQLDFYLYENGARVGAYSMSRPGQTAR
jgi:hypothetical protein